MDPITIGAAFAVAKAAVAGVKEAIALGHEIQDCYKDISAFFTAQGEIQAAVIQQEHDQKLGKSVPKDATAEALDAMFASRQMFKMEVELREALIYGSGNESGLYEEMCQRRDAIIQARRKALEDEAYEIRQREYALKRKKEQRIQNIQEWLAVVLGVSISSFIMYAVWWMFKQGNDK
jgi:hypothetical protein